MDSNGLRENSRKSHASEASGGDQWRVSERRRGCNTDNAARAPTIKVCNTPGSQRTVLRATCAASAPPALPARRCVAWRNTPKASSRPPVRSSLHLKIRVMDNRVPNSPPRLRVRRRRPLRHQDWSWAGGCQPVAFESVSAGLNSITLSGMPAKTGPSPHRRLRRRVQM